MGHIAVQDTHIATHISQVLQLHRFNKEKRTIIGSSMMFIIAGVHRGQRKTRPHTLVPIAELRRENQIGGVSELGYIDRDENRASQRQSWDALDDDRHTNNGSSRWSFIVMRLAACPVSNNH